MATRKVTPVERAEAPHRRCWAAGSWASATPTPTRRFPIFMPAAGSCRGCWCCATRRPSIVEREAARYGYEEFCTDWHELAADPRIDVFDNCGPDPVHAEPCIAALAARQARDLREADGGFASSRGAADARRGGRGAGQGDVYVQLPLHARRALGQGPDRRGPLGTVYQIRVQLLADGRPRSVAAAGQGVVLGLAALRRPAGHRQPRHRPVPLPGGRDRQRLGLGADVQQGPAPSPAPAARPR